MDKLMTQVEVQVAPIPAAEFKEWITTHGFFAWTGKFMLYVNGKPRATHTRHELGRFCP
ncbi:hypothetical protein F4604DRAFT_1954098 [Suillus subluteus]|nr:hypothetical protein F4604DRAFT_1954098 [Suillus subluteus]